MKNRKIEQAPRIMLVEDEVIVALDVQQRLENQGYEVVAHATSGGEAVRFASELDIDLILMDVKLRGKMDGIEAATQIRRLKDIPIIYLSAFGDENTLERARTSGILGYLVKPFDDRELHSAIESTLSGIRGESGLRQSE